MSDPYDYCPKCDGVRCMSVSVSLNKVPGGRGEIEEVLMVNYHCEICQTFVCQVPYEEINKAEPFAWSTRPTPIQLHHASPI